jgi:hypothetical protein
MVLYKKNSQNGSGLLTKIATRAKNKIFQSPFKVLVSVNILCMQSFTLWYERHQFNKFILLIYQPLHSQICKIHDSSNVLMQPYSFAQSTQVSD